MGKIQLILIWTAIFFYSLGSYAQADSVKDYACIYSTERSFSDRKNLLGHVEYGKEFRLSQQNDDRNYGTRLKEKSFFKNWNNLPLLISQLNKVYLKVPDFADQLVESSDHFDFRMKELADFDIMQDTSVCRGVSSPQNQTPDYVLSVAGVIGRGSKLILIDSDIFNRFSAADQVGLVFNLMVNAYLGLNTESTQGTVDQFDLEPQLKIRMISAMALDQDISAQTWLEYLNEALQGIVKISKDNEAYFWKGRHDKECYSHANLDMPIAWQCFIESSPAHNYSVQTSAIRRRKAYLTYDTIEGISKNCEEFEGDYRRLMDSTLQTLSTLNQNVYDRLGSRSIGQICNPEVPFGKPQISVNGFIFETKYEFCEGYNYHRTLYVDGLLMNGAYGLNTMQSPRHGSGGIYNRKATFINHRNNEIIEFDWSGIVDWTEFSNSTDLIRSYFSRLASNQFRCDVDINKAYSLREIRGLN